MKKCIFPELIFCEGLTYNQAMECTNYLSKSDFAEDVDFCVESEICNKWSVKGRLKKWSNSFLSNPDKFVIDLKD